LRDAAFFIEEKQGKPPPYPLNTVANNIPSIDTGAGPTMRQMFLIQWNPLGIEMMRILHKATDITGSRRKKAQSAEVHCTPK
jgi:hypothetical protein